MPLLAVLLCVGVCACVCMHGEVRGHLWVLEVNCGITPQGAAGVSHWPTACQGWTVSPRDLLVSTTPSARITRAYLHTGLFSQRFWGLESGPHAYTAAIQTRPNKSRAEVCSQWTCWAVWGLASPLGVYLLILWSGQKGSSLSCS